MPVGTASTAHNDAYKKSIWGPVMAGPTGDSIRALLAKAPKLVGNSLLAEPLLDGKSPKELEVNLTDLKHASKLIDLIADTGVIVGGEVREPRPTLKGVGSALGGLLGGKMPGPEAIIPDAQFLVIVPDAGDRADVLFSAIRLLMRAGENHIEKLPADSGRTGFQFTVAKPGGPPFPIHAAWWVEGKHFVIYAGTMRPDVVMKEVAGNAKKGGITGHPLYQRINKDPGFESVARGFVDTARVMGLAKSLIGPFVPGIRERIDDLGLGGLQAAVFNSGFDGRESRATWEFDLPGERKGLAKVLKQQPLGLADLPPMPPDVSRFSALRVDPTATYNAGIMAIEAITMTAPIGVEDDAKSGVEKVRARREYLEKEFEKLIGLNVREDVLPYTGDKVVVFQSPTEGISAFGTVICVSLKDPAKIKAASDRVNRGLETIASAPDQGSQENAPRLRDPRALFARFRHPHADLRHRRRLDRCLDASAGRAGLHPPREGRTRSMEARRDNRGPPRQNAGGWLRHPVLPPRVRRAEPLLHWPSPHRPAGHYRPLQPE